MPEVHRSTSAEETEALGSSIARRFAPLGLVLLEGELGAGKTTLARGIARGLGIDPDEVASPTFALLNEYGHDADGSPRLRHLDLYRIETVDSLRETGVLDLLDEDVPVLVEWPKGALDAPGRTIRVRIRPVGPTEREIEIDVASAHRGRPGEEVDERRSRR